MPLCYLTSLANRAAFLSRSGIVICHWYMSFFLLLFLGGHLLAVGILRGFSLSDRPPVRSVALTHSQLHQLQHRIIWLLYITIAHTLERVVVETVISCAILTVFARLVKVHALLAELASWEVRAFFGGMEVLATLVLAKWEVLTFDFALIDELSCQRNRRCLSLLNLTSCLLVLTLDFWPFFGIRNVYNWFRSTFCVWRSFGFGFVDLLGFSFAICLLFLGGILFALYL